jgi:hypothetical protein
MLAHTWWCSQGRMRLWRFMFLSVVLIASSPYIFLYIYFYDRKIACPNIRWSLIAETSQYFSNVQCFVVWVCLVFKIKTEKNHSRYSEIKNWKWSFKILFFWIFWLLCNNNTIVTTTRQFWIFTIITSIYLYVFGVIQLPNSTNLRSDEGGVVGNPGNLPPDQVNF